MAFPFVPFSTTVLWLVFPSLVPGPIVCLLLRQHGCMAGLVYRILVGKKRISPFADCCFLAHCLIFCSSHMLLVLFDCTSWKNPPHSTNNSLSTGLSSEDLPLLSPTLIVVSMALSGPVAPLLVNSIMEAVVWVHRSTLPTIILPHTHTIPRMKGNASGRLQLDLVPTSPPLGGEGDGTDGWGTPSDVSVVVPSHQYGLPHLAKLSCPIPGPVSVSGSDPVSVPVNLSVTVDSFSLYLRFLRSHHYSWIIF